MTRPADAFGLLPTWPRPVRADRPTTEIRLLSESDRAEAIEILREALATSEETGFWPYKRSHLVARIALFERARYFVPVDAA